MHQILVYSEIALLSEKFHTILLSKLQFALDQTQPDTIFSIIIRCITTREIRRAQNGSVTKKDFGPHPPSKVCETQIYMYFACTTLVYCNSLREVRLGGWGSRGPKGLV